jgi:hypothetical protein
MKAVSSSGMRGCGYATLEQCKISNAGKNGTRDRDSFFKNPKDALAQAPKGRVAKQAVQH